LSIDEAPQRLGIKPFGKGCLRTQLGAEAVAG